MLERACEGAEETSIGIDEQGRVEERRVARFTVPLVHSNDDEHTRIARGTTKPFRGLVRHRDGFSKQLDVERAKRMRVTRRDGPHPHRIAGDEGFGEHDEPGAVRRCLVDRSDRPLDCSVPVEQHWAELSGGDQHRE